MRKIPWREPPESFRKIALCRICGVANVVTESKIGKRRRTRRERENPAIQLRSKLPRFEVLIATHVG